MESESSPNLISPFESTLQQGKEKHHNLIPPHPHIPLPPLQAHSDSNDAAAREQNTDAALDQHPQIQRARQKAKARYLQSPLLEAEEYIFPRFSSEELSLGKVLGRGGFGTVLEVRKFWLRAPGHDVPLVSSADEQENNGRTKGGPVDIPAVREVKSFDALGEMQPSASRDDDTDRFGELRMCTSHEEPTRRKRRSVSLGFGSKHSFFRGGKRAGRDHSQSLQVEVGQLQIDGRQFMKQQLERKREGNTPEKDDDGHIAAQNKRDRHSINFSFISWRDSVPGQEGCNALDESYLDAMSSTYLSPPTEDEIEAPMMTEEGDDDNLPPVTDVNTEMNGSAPCHDDVATNSLETEFPSPPHSPIINSNTINKPDKSPPRRRIILYSKTNDGVNTTFEETDMDTSLPRVPNRHDKNFMSKYVTTSKGKARYVVKIISPHIVRGDFSKFVQAAADMATETYFFSVLNHPHILKMRAVGQSDMFSPSYFLVLDRLYETLDHKIAHSWKKHKDHLKNDFFVWGRYRKNMSFWTERVGVARDLAGALSYLHEMYIIYRDLKPENVGFDSKGIPKLFDFGLAKQVRREDENDGTYRLTANTGSLRYMSPEVGNGWPYNFKADSYSFTILLWEMLALEMPFAAYTAQEIVNMVRKWGERPKLKEEWSVRLKEGMQNGWDSNFRKRPAMKDFEVMLELELHESQTE